MPDLSRPEITPNVQALAQRIVHYETREKGVMGRLFGFEARDGLFSKLIKTLGPIGSAVSGASIAFFAVAALVTGPVGVAVAGVAAAAAGLISGGIQRAANARIFSDLHDSYTGDFAKFGHFVGTGLIGGVVSSVLDAVVPGLSLVNNSVVFPLARVMTSKGIASGLGNQQQRTESAVAKQIAWQAIQSGQSVEQVLAKSTSVTRVQNDLASEAPEHSLEVPEHSSGKSRNFVQMIEQQRSEAPAASLTK